MAFFMVAGSTLAKASLTGAKTVMSWAEFRVSTRPADLTAPTRVESSGLLLAAVATGSVAMPLKEPLPSFGTAAQPAPNWAFVASMGAEEVMLSEGLGVSEADAAGLWAAASVELAELPQADRPSGTARARAAIRLLRRVFIMVSLRGGV